MNNLAVIKAWEAGEKAKSGNLSTDGYNLYSYRLLIGVTGPAGEPFDKYIRNATAKGSDYFSKTTSQHVGMAVNNTGAKLLNINDQNHQFLYEMYA